MHRVLVVTMKTWLGDCLYNFPGPKLKELEDHTELYEKEDWLSLREQLNKLGYLRIRGLHQRDTVIKARTGMNLTV